VLDSQRRRWSHFHQRAFHFFAKLPTKPGGQWVPVRFLALQDVDCLDLRP
jgi:hypothetical protein